MASSAVWWLESFGGLRVALDTTYYVGFVGYFLLGAWIPRLAASPGRRRLAWCLAGVGTLATFAGTSLLTFGVRDVLLATNPPGLSWLVQQHVALAIPLLAALVYGLTLALGLAVRRVPGLS